MADRTKFPKMILFMVPRGCIILKNADANYVVVQKDITAAT